MNRNLIPLSLLLILSLLNFEYDALSSMNLGRKEYLEIAIILICIISIIYELIRGKGKAT